MSATPDKTPAGDGTENSVPVFVPLRDWRVVLVSPLTPENIGAAARVMKNFGAMDLVLVDPRCALEPGDKAEALATRHATDVLQNRREVATLADALADCHFSIALTMRSSADRPVDFTGFVPESLLARAPASGAKALVFGREDHGMTNEECSLCTARWSIPSNPGAPSFNLAQSIAIALAGVAQALEIAPVADQSEHPATQEEIEGLLQHLTQVLEAAEYERGVPLEHPLRIIRRLALRSRMESNEVRVLRGVCRRLLNALLGYKRRP